jgi:hypothetical protein
MIVHTPVITPIQPPRPLLPRGAVDFDGVIHDYYKGWQGGMIYGEPNLGTKLALTKLSKKYELVVFTARHDLDAVRAWLRKHRLDQFFADVTNRKPVAAWYLDDRGMLFTTWEHALENLL